MSNIIQLIQEHVCNLEGDYLALPSISKMQWLLPLNVPGNYPQIIDYYYPMHFKSKFFKYCTIMAFKFRIASLFLKKNILQLKNHTRSILPLDNYFATYCDQNRIAVSLLINPQIQKIVALIVNHKGQTLGCAKIGLSKYSRKLIANECKALGDIRELSLTSITYPRVISSHIFGDAPFFIIEPFNNNLGLSTLCITKTHLEFISELYCLTGKTSKLKNTSVYLKLSEDIRTAVNFAAKEWVDRLKKGIAVLESMHNIEIQTCFFHGDFTPWNIYCLGKNSKLYVTDWEYAEDEGLLLWDIFHFLIHVNVLIESFNEERMLHLLLNSERTWAVYDIINPNAISNRCTLKLYLTTYLLNISLRYLNYYKATGTLDLQTQRLLNILGMMMDKIYKSEE